MDFALTDEQRLVQEQARALLARHLPPAVARTQRAAGGACPAELWRVLAEAGWPGYGLPRAHGGLGADLVDLALLFEECGRALVPARLRATVSAGLLLAAAGRTAELPALARGTQVAALAAVEPEAGADPARLTTTLAGGRLDGEKRFVVAGAEADVLVVAARGAAGLALALAGTARRFTAATLAAHQLHGGMGFVTEYPLHLYSNRARAGEVLLGTYGEHLERIARARGL